MIDMPKLSYHYKLPGRSIPEVYERFNQALIRHQMRGRVKFQDRKLSAEALTNAAVLRFLDLDTEAQESILADYVPRFEAMLSDPPVADVAPARTEARHQIREKGKAAQPTGKGKTA